MNIVERLRDAANDTDAVENASVARLLDEAAAEIERLRAEKETRGEFVDRIADAFLERRWIPVDERLPDDEAEALIAFEDRSIGVAYAVFHHVEEDGSQKWTDGNGFELKQPTHWMPLPEPPEVE